MNLYNSNLAAEITMEGTKIMRTMSVSFRAFGRRHKILSIYGKEKDMALVGGMRPHTHIACGSEYSR
jgi:hypothetical protein